MMRVDPNHDMYQRPAREETARAPLTAYEISRGGTFEQKCEWMMQKQIAKRKRIRSEAAKGPRMRRPSIRQNPF